MASVFTLFGDLQMETGAFERSVKNSGLQLIGLQGQLAKTEAAASKIGRIGLNDFAIQLRAADKAALSLDSRLKGLVTNLSGFQKRQLSFQANDILTGLLSGQNVTQILAQQGGQVVQIFQQGAAASKEMAVATEATAAGMKEASGAATLFGYSIVGIGATLAAGVVTILAAKKISEDILKSANDRLKAEEAVVGALNKQYLAAKALKEELAEIGSKGRFERTLQSFGDGSAGIGQLKQFQTNLQQQYDANLRSVTSEINRRAAEADAFGLKGNARSDFINGATPAGMAETQRNLAEQIKGIASRIEDLRTSEPSGMDWYTQIQKQQREALKTNQSEVLKAEKELAAERKRLIDESIRQAKEFAAYVKQLRTEDAQKFGKTIDAYNLRADAKNFGQGFLSKKGSVSQELQGRLEALLGLELKERLVGFAEANGVREAITRTYRGFANRKLSPEDQSALDKKIIELTQGLDPASLTRGQNDLAKTARLREADRIEKDRDEINKKLLKALENPKTLDVVVTSELDLGIGSSGNVNTRYLRRGR